jgi:hypothetical protein
MGCPESNCHRSCVSWGRFHRTYGGRWEQSVGEKRLAELSCKTEKRRGSKYIRNRKKFLSKFSTLSCSTWICTCRFKEFQ